MQTIQLKTTQESVNDPRTGKLHEFELTTKELIKTALNNSSSPQGGFPIDDMMIRLKILTKLELIKPEDTVFELEDSDFNKLGEYAKAVNWGFVSQTFPDFVNQFNSKI